MTLVVAGNADAVAAAGGRARRARARNTLERRHRIHDLHDQGIGLPTPVRRRTTPRSAAGVTVCRWGRIPLLLLPREAQVPGIAVTIPADVLVPVWAQSAGMAP
ncbi:hypothetical protein GCM10010129_58380 [Streptomyces fumigatiscleroticus]|nr:hypothetical protein GCM10010129_58380 [Streptomyces fumigatiscleroticus]